APVDVDGDAAHRLAQVAGAVVCAAAHDAPSLWCPAGLGTGVFLADCGTPAKIRRFYSGPGEGCRSRRRSLGSRSFCFFDLTAAGPPRPGGPVADVRRAIPDGEHTCE